MKTSIPRAKKSQRLKSQTAPQLLQSRQRPLMQGSHKEERKKLSKRRQELQGLNRRGTGKGVLSRARPVHKLPNFSCLKLLTPEPASDLSMMPAEMLSGGQVQKEIGG
mmetsp:Transcript_13384/g.25188  ORF Transcript_13384/g.25188 Transcript_13384/m.25188 type:complete len:108 (+) Transcript_13384:1729-2052(+)